MIQTVNRYLYDIYKSIWLQSIQFIVMEPDESKTKTSDMPPPLPISLLIVLPFGINVLYLDNFHHCKCPSMWQFQFSKRNQTSFPAINQFLDKDNDRSQGLPCQWCGHVDALCIRVLPLVISFHLKLLQQALKLIGNRRKEFFH